MKIIDAFIFYDELDLLKIRLEFLYDFVDYFVICESSVTFTGRSKRWNFFDHREAFSPWLDKIIYLKYEPTQLFLDGCKSAWQVEAAQRNFLATELVKFDKNDWAIISDVDEIWNPEVVMPYLKNNKIRVDFGNLEMLFHYYYLNCRGIGVENSTWRKAFFIRVNRIQKKKDINKIREGKQKNILNNAGWHFSYLGGVKKIIDKIESFSHQELNSEKIKNAQRLEDVMRLGKDPFDREGHEWAFHPIDYYPRPLASLMKKYSQHTRNTLNE